MLIKIGLAVIFIYFKSVVKIFLPSNLFNKVNLLLFLEINKKFFEDKKAMHTQMRLDTTATAIEKFNTDEKQLKQARKQSIENLLTAEQKTKWQAHKKQFMQEKKKNMPPKPKQGAGPGPGPKPIENDIDLD